MSKKPSMTEEDLALFRDAVKGAKKVEAGYHKPATTPDEQAT